VIGSDAKLFKKNWISFPWLKKSNHTYEEHPKIVEIVKHVPVIQRVEVIKPVEIIKTVHIPGEIPRVFFLI
jgi:hypothetical protein